MIYEMLVLLRYPVVHKSEISFAYDCCVKMWVYFY